MPNNLITQSVYLPKHSYTNGTSKVLKEYFVSKNITVVEGNNLNSQKNKLWTTTSLIIPPTNVTEKTFLARVNELNPHIITPKTLRALNLAKTKHAGQMRQNKTDYFTGHILPCTLYLILVQMQTYDCLTEDMVIAMLCHDLIEDTDITLDYLSAEYGTTVARYVELLTKKPKKEYFIYENFMNLPKEERKAVRNKEYVEQVLTGDYEVLVLKCVDRTLNLTDDIQNLVQTDAVERVKDYAKESNEYYLAVFERVAVRNPYYLGMLGVLLDIISQTK